MEDKTGTFEYTRGTFLTCFFLFFLDQTLTRGTEVLKKLDRQTREEVARLGGNPKLEKFIESMKID
jgi:hypothetical protein